MQVAPALSLDLTLNMEHSIMTTRIEAWVDLTLLEAGAEGGTVMHSKPATQRQIESVMKADPTSMDGRSNWLIFTLPNGDVIFGCYPEGATYEEVMA